MCDYRQRTTNHGRRTTAFTLIELLAVIGIIAILATFLLPTMRVVFQKAKKVRAQTEIKSIETAVKAYYSDYGKLPQQSSSDSSFGELAGVDNSQLMDILRTNNPRKNLYLDIPQNSLVNNNFVDPWGKQYEITIDMDFNNICNSTYTSVTNKMVVIWSRGPNKDPNPPPNDVDDIRSWE